MSRWMPHPWMAAAVLIGWLLLNETVSLGQVLLGALLSVAAGLAYARLSPGQAAHGRRHPAAARAWRAMRLFGRVLADMVRSSIDVARIVLRPRDSGRRSGFVECPLELRDPAGLAVLACIVTATPGTSWASYDRQRGTLTIHVLDLRDEAAWIADFKARYEHLLLELYE